MNPRAIACALALLLAAATGVRAEPEVLRGRWRGEGRVIPLPFVLRRAGDGFVGAAPFTRDAPPWRLRLRPDGAGWALEVEQPLPATAGVAGALDGQRGQGWRTARRTVALREQNGTLHGAEFAVEAPPREVAAAPDPRPTPYDTGWFTDADALPPPPGLRRYLDAALATGDPERVVSLPLHQLHLASPDEKARLVEHLLRAGPGAREQAWIGRLFDVYRDRGGPLQVAGRSEEGARTLAALLRRGRALDLVNGVDDPGFHDLLAEHVRGPGQVAALVGALAARDTRPRRLAAHHLLDRARAEGWLDAALAGLARAPSATIQDLVRQARPTRRPLVVAHRGDPVRFPENTLPALRSALERGADALEIDVCLTRDDRLVLWHDEDPDGGAVALVRNLGLEPGQGYRPTYPELGSAARRPIHGLTLAEVRANFGYARRDAALSGGPFPLPTLDEVAAWLERQPGVRLVCLDVKVPAEGDLPARFGRALRRVLDRNPALAARAVIMTPDAAVLRGVRTVLGRTVGYTHDVEITTPLLPAMPSAVAAALALGNDHASVGRPRIPIAGGELAFYLELLRADRARIERERLPVRLISWTINDELEMREIVAIGVDGILTDDPALLRSVLDRLGL